MSDFRPVSTKAEGTRAPSSTWDGAGPRGLPSGREVVSPFFGERGARRPSASVVLRSTLKGQACPHDGAG
ncbi:unnamed protein product [Amoebophrya sp. A25]|nr:unnamed protein product [Amoebophrya sp. A25]CAD7967897.1 unnamed protein product [Amoebophrya sp. A25]|eukprot:GSA25T00021399001.1